MTTTSNNPLPYVFMSVYGTMETIEGRVQFPKNTRLVFNIFQLISDYQLAEYKKLLKSVPPENIVLDTPMAVNKNYPNSGPRNKLVVFKPLDKWLES